MKIENQNNEKYFYYLALFIIGLMSVSILVWKCTPLIYPFANDSAGYIQESKNILSGYGFVRTPGSAGSWDSDMEPSIFFPPGYSLLIAGLSLLTHSVENAALLVSRISWVFVPVAVAFALLPALGRKLSFVIGATSIVSPGLYQSGFQALSDVPFLLITTLSLGFFTRGVIFEKKSITLFIAGLLAGISYCVRNAGTALILCELVGFFLVALYGNSSVRELINKSFFWIMGIVIPVGLLFFHNFTEFGHFQPYASGQSNYGWVLSARIFLWSILLDTTGIQAIADLAWDFKRFLAILVPVAGVLGWLALRNFRSSSLDKRLSLLILSVYLFTGSAMIIVGRAKYDWVETNLARYVMQYTWLLTGLLCFSLIKVFPKSLKASTWVTSVVLVSLLAGRLAYINQDIHRETSIAKVFRIHNSFFEAVKNIPDRAWVVTNQIRMGISQNKGLMDKVSNTEPNALILSNLSSVIELESDRHVRSLELKELNLTLEEWMHFTNQGRLSMRPLYIIFIPDNSNLRSNKIVNWQDRLIASSNNEFEIYYRDANVLMIRLKKNSTLPTTVSNFKSDITPALLSQQ